MSASAGSSDQLNTILSRIRNEYPSLRFEFVQAAPVPAARLPVQPGLDFEIGISVQGDELHLTPGSHFWVEQFPSSTHGLVEDFVASVLGLISGRCRIVESYVAGRAIAARFECQDDREIWMRAATWGNLGCLLPLPRRETVLRNTHGT